MRTLKSRHAVGRSKNRPQGQVRIIGGQWRGRRIEFYAACGLRPTGDRIRETLFNWLQGEVENADCLDLFTGSGALAFEAASRGARRVVMIENNRATQRQLQNQIALFKATNIELVPGTAQGYLQDYRQAFDLIFLDPPFDRTFLPEIIDLLGRGHHLKPHTKIYLEYPFMEIPDLPPGWAFVRQKKTGEVGYGLVALL